MFARFAGLVLLSLMTSTAFAAPGKVIMDTDPGRFSDDESAAVMLLRSPESVQLLGMTVVAGNTWAAEGYGYMSHVLGLLHRGDVPMHIGAQHPLVHTADMAKVEEKNWGPLEFTGGFAKPLPPAGASLRGVEFLIESIDRASGQATVLAIGPMTNLAIALRLRPDLERKIQRVVFMGGTLRDPGNVTKYAEFNFWFDPEAAQVVFRSAIREKVMFGLDICNRAKITRKHFDQIVAAKTPITELYRDVAGNEYPGFLKDPNASSPEWDTLAANYLLDPGFVTRSEEHYLDIDTTFGPKYGAVVQLDRKVAPSATPVRVMLDLDFDRFFERFKRLMTAK